MAGSFSVLNSSMRLTTLFPAKLCEDRGMGYYFATFPQTAPLVTGDRLPRKEIFCTCPWRELGAFFMRETAPKQPASRATKDARPHPEISRCITIWSVPPDSLRDIAAFEKRI
jgi:hypothetical protein